MEMDHRPPRWVFYALYALMLLLLLAQAELRLDVRWHQLLELVSVAGPLGLMAWLRRNGATAPKAAPLARSARRPTSRVAGGARFFGVQARHRRR